MTKIVIPCYFFFVISMDVHLRDREALQWIVVIFFPIFSYFFMFIYFSLYLRFHALWGALGAYFRTLLS